MTSKPSIADRIKTAIASGCIADDGHSITGTGHAPRCTSPHSAALANAGVRHVYIASGGQPSRAFPLEVIEALESETGLRLCGKVSRSKTAGL